MICLPPDKEALPKLIVGTVDELSNKIATKVTFATKPKYQKEIFSGLWMNNVTSCYEFNRIFVPACLA